MKKLHLHLLLFKENLIRLETLKKKKHQGKSHLSRDKILKILKKYLKQSQLQELEIGMELIGLHRPQFQKQIKKKAPKTKQFHKINQDQDPTIGMGPTK